MICCSIVTFSTINNDVEKFRKIYNNVLYNKLNLIFVNVQLVKIKQSFVVVILKLIHFSNMTFALKKRKIHQIHI